MLQGFCSVLQSFFHKLLALAKLEIAKRRKLEKYDFFVKDFHIWVYYAF